jgi:N-acetylglutamate synthase
MADGDRGSARGRDLLLQIEHAGVHAWPALEWEDIDGWRWRFSDGGSQRANSVSALDFCGSDCDAAIVEAERRYAARGVKAMFQVSDVATPGDLDRRLAARGYTINDPCTTLIRDIDRTQPTVDGVEYFDQATTEWFDCYASVLTPERKRTAPRILAGIPRDSAFCALRRDGRVVATALAVPFEGIVVAECVATLAEARGSGAASLVMRGLEAWAAAKGCTISALQALQKNAPAQALYQRLGYRRFGSYHLRVQG